MQYVKIRAYAPYFPTLILVLKNMNAIIKEIRIVGAINSFLVWYDTKISI